LFDCTLGAISRVFQKLERFCRTRIDDNEYVRFAASVRKSA
jgi:hypothetical protein